MIVGLGHPWIFWPVLLLGGVLQRGPGRWGWALTWLLILVLVSPFLFLGIQAFLNRQRTADTPDAA